jgi:hypothetical protein
VCINYAFDGKLSNNAAQREQPLPHPDHHSAEYYIGQPPYWYSPNGFPRNHIADRNEENENSSDGEALRAAIAALPRLAPMPKRMPKARAHPFYQVGGSSSSSTAPVIVIDAPTAVAPPTQTRPAPPPAHSSSHQRPNGSPIPPWRQPVQLRPPPPPPSRELTVQELWRMNSHSIQMQQLMTWGGFIANCLAFHQSHLPVPAAPSTGEVVPLNTTGLTNVSFPLTPFVDLQHMIPPTLPAATTPASTLPAPHTLPAATTRASTPPTPHPAQTAPTPEQALPEPEPEVCYEDEETLRSLLLGYASSMPAAPVIPRPPKGSPPASIISPPTQPTREPEGPHAVRSQSTTPLCSDDEREASEAAARAAAALQAHTSSGRRRRTLSNRGSRNSGSSSAGLHDDEWRMRLRMGIDDALHRPTIRPRPAKAVNCARMHAPRLYHACACHPQIKMRMYHVQRDIYIYIYIY